MTPPVTRVEFWLEDKRILVKNRAPYTVELDLGKIPKKQTLKVLGFDVQGNFVDADAWAINEKDARLAVRILELPKKPDAKTVDYKVSVQSIAGGTARSVALYLDADLVTEWKEPPFVVAVDAAKLKKATLVRATAVDEEGKEFSDIKLLKGDSRFMSKVEVNLVELHVSVYEPDGHFAKGLKKDDFTILEDGVPQEVSAFEFAEALPISLGIVIDGSGSMRDAMPLVHEAAGEFVNHLSSRPKRTRASSSSSARRRSFSRRSRTSRPISSAPSARRAPRAAPRSTTPPSWRSTSSARSRGGRPS